MTRVFAALTLAIAALALAPAAGAAQPVVVLVSGLSSRSPFSTPAPSCAGKEGPSWGIPNGVAQALKAQHFAVYTAPVTSRADSPPPTTCEPLPPSDTWIDSTGDLDANGRALNRFLTFLERRDGVREVELVGHSDGGLWSRSAIATHAGTPVIRALSTLGTPHTGSYVADSGAQIAGLSCAAGTVLCPNVQHITDTLIRGLGGDAVGELTSTFMVSWSAPRTTGPCRVTVFAGDAVNPPAPPPPQRALPAYYTPSDGLVGLSSALATSSVGLDGSAIPAPSLPGLADGGTFPIFHFPPFGISEIDYPPLNRALVRALRKPSAPCAGSVAPRSTTVATLPFYTPTESSLSGGRLPSSNPADVVLALRGTSVTCAGKPLESSPLLPTTLVQAIVPGHCNALNTSALALMLRETASSASVTVSRRRLTVVLHGPPVSGLTAQVQRGNQWSPLPLDHGSAAIPPSNVLSLRLYARGSDGAPLSAPAELAQPGVSPRPPPPPPPPRPPFTG